MHERYANTVAIPNSSSRSNRYSRTSADTDTLVHTASSSNHPRTDAIAFDHADTFTDSHLHGHTKPDTHPDGRAEPDTLGDTAFCYHHPCTDAVTFAHADTHPHGHANPHTGVYPGRS